MGWTVPGEKAAQQTLAKYIHLENSSLRLFCSQGKCAAFVPSLLCRPQSNRTNTTAPKPLLMLCTWLFLCSCYIHKLLVVLRFFIAHVSGCNFLLVDAAGACRAELLHLEWHFGGWALQGNKPSKVKLYLCYFGVAGLPLSSCMWDLALGFCIFANSLRWLSVPSQ